MRRTGVGVKRYITNSSIAQMKVFYFHTPDLVPQTEVPDAAVVIDVLRASTTIAFLLHHGAEAVETFDNLDKLREAAAAWPNSLTAGERGGKKVPDFDLGNSPAAIHANPTLISGKRIFFSTTNGTRTLQRVRNVQNVFTAALPNRTAVAKRLEQFNNNVVWIVGSGWEGSYSLEDSLCGGAVAAALGGESVAANDEMVAAIALWERYNADTEGCLRRASHGQRLMCIGNHDDDFRSCSAVDTLQIVPFQAEPGVLKGS